MKYNMVGWPKFKVELVGEFPKKRGPSPQTLKIIWLHQKGYKHKDIAERFGISIPRVSKIISDYRKRNES